MKAYIHIDQNIKPIAQPYRRIPIALENRVIAKLNEMLEQDIIEYVNQPSCWISPMVIVPKKEEIRICIDMRRANCAILREHFPLPTFEEISHKLLGCQFYSKLDIQQAFHQLELDEACRYITTFITPLGLMRYKRLLFGLSSAPETFQKTMQFIISGLEGVLVFIDDLIVFAKDEKQHTLRLNLLMDRLKWYNVKLNSDKCQLGMKELDFLGYHITANGVKVSQDKVNSIINFSIPKSAAELSSFLGLISYVCKYIPHLSTITYCLNDLTRKGKQFIWQNHHQEAFQKIKDIIGNQEALALFDPDCCTYLFTDASPVGLGAVVVQKQNKINRICAYASKTLSDTEKRYAQTEKEALAIVWGVERFHYLLFGIEFTIFTDHRPLTYIFNELSKPCLRIERWVLRLQSYKYSIQYVTGKNNIADPFSRLMQEDKEEKENFDKCETIIQSIFSDFNSISLKEIREATKQDNEIQEVVKCLQSDKWSKELCRFKLIASELCFENEILFRGTRIIVPNKLQRKVIELAHEGHLGIVKLKKHLRELVWFPFMDKKIEQFVTDCFGCTLVSSTDTLEPIKCTELPTKPWNFLAIDFLGPLQSKEYILVVVDYYSRYIEIEIMTSITASNTFRRLRIMFSRHGYPEKIKADFGPQFRDEFKNLCDQYDIELVHSLPYAPHQNGQVERQNQGILKSIKISKALGRDWKMDLDDYLLAYRSTPQMTTNVSPAEMLFGRKIKTRLPMIKHSEVNDTKVRETDCENKNKGKERADKKAKKMNINAGDTVVVKRFIKKHKTDSNFDPQHHLVIERCGTKVKVKNMESGVVHERYVGHTKKVSTANPFFDIPEMDSDLNCQPDLECSDSTEISTGLKDRPKRQMKVPAKLSDYEVYQVQ